MALTHAVVELEKLVKTTYCKCFACAWYRVLGSPEAAPETRIHGKVIYWEAIPGEARGKWEREGKEAKQGYQAKLHRG